MRLTSLVAEGLNLSRWSPSYEATGTVRRKISTQQTLGEEQEVPAHWVAPALFASPVARVRDVGDLDEALKKVSSLPTSLSVCFVFSCVRVCSMAILSMFLSASVSVSLLVALSLIHI